MSPIQHSKMSRIVALAIFVILLAVFSFVSIKFAVAALLGIMVIVFVFFRPFNGLQLFAVDCVM